MQKYRAAEAGDARTAVVIDLDNEIVEVVVALQPVAAVVPIQPYRLVVVTAPGVFAPGVLRPDGANRQERMRPRVTVGAPPQSPRPEGPFRGPAIALALVGDDAAAPKCDRDRLTAGREPASAGIPGSGANSHHGERPITQICRVRG